MTNTSIFAAFERMWLHIVAALGNKAADDVIVVSDTEPTSDTCMLWIKVK